MKTVIKYFEIELHWDDQYITISSANDDLELIFHSLCIELKDRIKEKFPNLSVHFEGDIIISYPENHNYNFKELFFILGIIKNLLEEIE